MSLSVHRGKFLTNDSSNPNVSFLVARFFQFWWSWTECVQDTLLTGIEDVAKADQRAVEWNALRDACWWINWRSLLQEGWVRVNGSGWVSVRMSECPS